MKMHTNPQGVSPLGSGFGALLSCKTAKGCGFDCAVSAGEIHTFSETVKKQKTHGSKKGLSEDAICPQYIVVRIDGSNNILGITHHFPTAPYYVSVYFQQLFRADLENTVCLPGAWL